MNDSIYYVYVHVCPEGGGVVYVGKGCYGRAWDVTRNRYNCNPLHVEWMKALCEKGYTPDEWVNILRQRLSEEDAFHYEKDYMHKHGQPRFNQTAGERNHRAKLTDDQAREIYTRCKDGETHNKLAEEFGVSRSAVSMISSRKQWRAATACLV